MDIVKLLYVLTILTLFTFLSFQGKCLVFQKLHYSFREIYILSRVDNQSGVSVDTPNIQFFFFFFLSCFRTVKDRDKTNRI